MHPIPPSPTTSPLSPIFTLAAGLALVAGLLLASPAAWGQAAPPPIAPSDGARLNPEQQRELDHLLDGLRDTRLPLARRRRAAAILLDRPWPPAHLALKRLLIRSSDRQIQRAIAQAVAETHAADPQLVQPLLNLLGNPDADLRADVAAALGQFDDDNLAAELITVAVDLKKPPVTRLGAIEALAEQRTQKAAGALIGLITAGDPTIRAAAFAALAQLSGIDDYGQNPDAWKHWWTKTGRLSPPRWQAMLVRHVATRKRRLAENYDDLVKRLAQTYGTLYEAADEKTRPALLAQLLQDPLEQLRLVALKLVEGRMLSALPVGDDLRQQLRGRLSDTSPRVRTGVAQLLEKLRDTAAAETVVELLLTEPDAGVQAAYLALLARVPRAQAVESAMELMDQAALRDAAAAFLVAAQLEGLLSPDQRGRALADARDHASGNPTPAAAMVRLLSHLGEEQDEAQIDRLLQHTDAAVREAAAEAFAARQLPLVMLFSRFDDKTLVPHIHRAVNRWGNNDIVLITLLEHPPADAALTAGWKQAAAAVIVRLEPDLLQRVDAYLARHDEHDELHEHLLKEVAGLNRTPGPSGTNPIKEPARLEAQLLLAAHYERTDQPAKAPPIYERLSQRKTLSPDQHRRLAAARIRFMLGQNQLGDAVLYTSERLADAQALGVEHLAGPWLVAAEAAAKAGDVKSATDLQTRIQQVFTDRLDRASQTRFDALATRLKEATPSPPDLPATPPGPADTPALP